MFNKIPFFNKFFNRKQTAVDESDWRQTSQASVFFSGYKDELTSETPQAEIVSLQADFLQRFDERMQQRLKKIRKADERDQYIIDEINQVRRFSPEMSIEIRTKLAQIKHSLLEK
ncbi:hypothetical protein [Convivina praedatoris]|uniref:Uncharacterized protein n=1 Tax=Convivina praedatoris TaxID=2880963 RepID=A0ABM9D5L5_9LACO|nr:hypothetical protein [Convivina sp. LMG 32447]CAH1855797.1 hypothetical protein R077815_01280 [Convivina sp. LMG 32447]CAH1856702.1 hypothetical protein LMG032447_01350 [Convivina sp. LMG 32447]CAH1856798.1 hypothetical protein R078138_01433 [Convivina sp. LMG 32447]